MSVVFSRGGAEEASGRDQCGLPETGAGEGAKQEDRPGAEDERGAKDQVRGQDRGPGVDGQGLTDVQDANNNNNRVTESDDITFCYISTEQSLL